MPKTKKTAPWIQITVAVLTVALAVIKFYFWRKKQQKTRGLEAELGVLNGYKELVELEVAAQQGQERLATTQRKLEDLQEEIRAKQVELNYERTVLEEEREKIKRAQNWDELFN